MDDALPGLAASVALAKMSAEDIKQVPRVVFRNGRIEREAAQLVERATKFEAAKRAVTHPKPDGMGFAVDDVMLERAVEAWLLGESHKTVARMLKVTEDSFRIWQTTRGWDALLSLYRDPIRATVHGKITRVISLTVAKIEDRIEHGDPVIDQNCKVVGHRPVKVKDLDTLLATLVDKQVLMEKRLSGEDSAPQLPEGVVNLLQRLEQLSREKPVLGSVPGDYREPSVIDVGEGEG